MRCLASKLNTAENIIEIKQTIEVLRSDQILVRMMSRDHEYCVNTIYMMS